jgi:hypothetical protein
LGVSGFHVERPLIEVDKDCLREFKIDQSNDRVLNSQIAQNPETFIEELVAHSTNGEGKKFVVVDVLSGLIEEAIEMQFLVETGPGKFNV